MAYPTRVRYYPPMNLEAGDKEKILKRVSDFERVTGVELVTAWRSRCDEYPEIPWKAFAIGVAAGSAVSAAVALVVRFTNAGWLAWADLIQLSSPGVPLALAMGSGLATAVAAILSRRIGRLFLSKNRAAMEALQAAKEMFLDHELFGVRSRTAILMLVAAFERRVVLLSDQGMRTHLPSGAVDQVTRAMAPALRSGNWSDAFVAGINVLEAIVCEAGFRGGTGENRLPDHIDSHRDEGDAC